MNNLKHIIIFSFIVFFSTLSSFSVEKENTLIKRTVLILPFFNEMELEEYDYLENALTKALKANLLNSNQFRLSNPVDLEKKIIGLNYSYDDLKKPINAIKLGEFTNSDIIIISTFIILEDNILIQMEAIDVFSGEVVAMTQKKSKMGFDLLGLIDEFSNEMTEKMITNFPLIMDKEYKELVQRKNKMKTMNYFSNPFRKTAISLSAIGGSFLIIGLPILIYDFAGYYQIYNDKKENYYSSNKGYDDLLNSYYIFISLFISGIISTSLGVTLLLASIPFYIIKFKPKNKNLIFSFGFNKSIELSLVYYF